MSLDTDAQVTDLAINDHACLTFGEAEELVDLTAAFVRDGLAGGLRVVWLSETPHVAADELGRRGILRGAAAVAPRPSGPSPGGTGGDTRAVTVMGCDEGLLTGQTFAVDHAVGWLREQVAASRRAGYRGLRVALDMTWALRPIMGIEQLPAFEREIAGMVGERVRQATGGALSVLCQYDRDRFDPVTLASVTPFHAHSVAAATYHDDELLRICRQYVPPGIRIAGQIDLQAQEALALALSEAIRIGGDITVNMTELTFIDVSTTRMILDAARSLAPSRRVVLQCHPAIDSRFVILGAADLRNVRVSRR